MPEALERLYVRERKDLEVQKLPWQLQGEGPGELGTDLREGTPRIQVRGERMQFPLLCRAPVHGEAGAMCV